MEVTDFDYDLPKELIAQTPIEPRDASRLLVMDKKTGRRVCTGQRRQAPMLKSFCLREKTIRIGKSL